MKCFFCSSSCVLLFFTLSTAERFTSTAPLQQLIDNHDEIISVVEEYMNKVKASAALKRYVRVMKKMRFDKHPKATLEFLEHPMNEYILAKRWSRIKDELETGSKALQKLDERLNELGVRLPGGEDVDEIIKGLFRLQKTYQLPMYELAEGEIKGFPAAIPPTVSDMYDIGTTALHLQEFDLAHEWLATAFMHNQIKQSAPENDIIVMFLVAINATGDYERAAKTAEFALEKDPSNTTFQELHKQTKAFLEKVNTEIHHKPSLREASESEILQEIYAELCRSDIGKTDPSDDLYCRYRTTSIPYINYKEEIYNLDPEISLIYQVISPAEAELVKHPAARKTVNRSRVGLEEDRNSRIHYHGWLTDENPVTSKLSRRLGLITGLDASSSSSETFQVINYGIGGQHTLHVDAYGADQEIKMSYPESRAMLEESDRVATSMFHIHAPVVGGATVFPELDIKIPSVQYGAVLWHNLKRSGEVDYRTLPTECPVLLGTKWVCNKSILVIDQNNED